MTYDPKVVASARRVNQERRNAAYAIAAIILALIVVISLWVAGVFSSATSYACNVQVTELHSNLVLSLSGNNINPSACASAVKQANAGAPGNSSAKQIAKVPDGYKLSCTGTENGTQGAVLVKVYTDGSSFAQLVGSLYCGQLDKVQ